MSKDGAVLARRNGLILFLLRSIAPFFAFLWAVTPVAAQQQTGVPVVNKAFLKYTTDSGTTDSLPATATVRVTKTSNIQLVTAVSRSSASLNDTLYYTIRWKNTGVGPASEFIINDSIDDGVTFIPGSVVSSSPVLTQMQSRTLQFNVATVARGDSGFVRFAALVKISEGEVLNSARATYASESEIRDAFSETVRTRIEPWGMQLEMQALSDVVHVGDTLTFRIKLTNPSHELELLHVTMTDTLPEQLHFISSDPDPVTFGNAAAIAKVKQTHSSGASAGDMIDGVDADDVGGAASWEFDSIGPESSQIITLKTLVMSVGNGEISNLATANGSGVKRALAAVAIATVNEKFGLTIHKSASALEVGTGEAVGFTVTVQNTGNRTADNVLVHDLPASGVKLQQSSVTGATLTQGTGELIFNLGTIEPGKQATVQYVGSVMAPRNSILTNSAWAIDAAGVRTDTTSVTVRVRDAAMLSRVVIGKVWLDENGDGRQQSTERPLSNAIVWSSRGETVRADSLGRFTFPDVNTGRYTFRVDPLSVPGGYDNAEPMSVRVDGFTTPVVSLAVPKGKAQVIAAARRGAGISLGGSITTSLTPQATITAPADGSVVGSNKIFLRVDHGFGGDSVQILDNGKPIAIGSLRGDGSADFLGLDVTPGPHKLEGIVTGPDGQTRPTINIHVSGEPKTVVRGDSAIIRAGATQVIAFNVLDQWKKPVAQKPYATVAVSGMHIIDADIDPSSVGIQLPVTPNGVLLVRAMADSAGPAHIDVSYGRELEGAFDLIVLPQIRSLVFLADGEIGAGATSKSYGTAVARGSIDSKTSVTLSYDSRRTHSETFGGAFDPLGESRYAVMGDASERSVLGSATSPLSLKVEHDRDWMLVGDIDTKSFGSDNSPAAYRRSLPGMSAHWLNGPVDVYGFGSMVAQQIVQKQIRGNGTSGPYDIGGEVRLGTDHLVIETRDRYNASLVVSRQELERFIDYDIDATTGSVLLRRPLGSTDASGNPLMLVASAEQLHGESSFVGGIHGQIAGSLFKSGRDTVRIGGGYIEDQSPLGGHNIASGELGANTKWGGSRFEIARGAAGDSAGVALSASAWVGSLSGSNATVAWNRVGDGFANPANPRLVNGTQDMRIGGQALLGAGWSVGGAYATQDFRARGASRAQSTMSIGRKIGDNKLSLDVGVLDEKQTTDTLSTDYRSMTSRLSYAVKRSTTWIDATQPLHNDGPERPSTYGIGTSYDIGHGIRAEASERLIKTDTALSGLSTLALRSEFKTGTRAWTEYQIGNSSSGSTSSALVGIGQKLKLSTTWSVDGQYERRAGLNRLPVTDVARALPFAQQEQDHWAASIGTEWTPSAIKARAGLRAEIHDGNDTGRGYRIFGSGEASLSNSVALLAREDTRQDKRVLNTGITTTQSSQTIIGAAFRPSARSDWNGLLKLELKNDENPLRNAGTLLAGTDRRIIGAAETVWTPSVKSELGLRFAVRHSQLGGLLANNGSITSNTQYAGARIRQQVTGRFDLRANARMITELHSGLTQWDIAPAVGVKLIQGLDLEAGYRLGDMHDVDFEQNGGHGFYATLGMSITEKTGQSIADFWRTRISGGR